MCRHLAYLGPDVLVSRVVLDPPHSLVHQAYAAKELLTGVVAADGFGVAWYQDDFGPEPAVYRSAMPIWADRNLESIATHARAHTVVANVRNATEVGTTAEANVHPFAHGRYTFSHNGYLESFRPSSMRRLRTELSDAQYAELGGATDSETMFRWWLSRIDEGKSARDALSALMVELVDMAGRTDRRAQLNVIVSDGEQVLATRVSDRAPSNSLYTLVDGDRFPGATLVASEPLDQDPLWRGVPEGHLVVAHAAEPVETRPLDV